MFSWYKYLIVCLVFSRLGFSSRNIFLIVPFLIVAYLYLFAYETASEYSVTFLLQGNGHTLTIPCYVLSFDIKCFVLNST